MSNIVPFNEMQTMAGAVTKSGMFGLKNENQALTLMMIAQAENIHPIQAVQMYSIINGMPALKTTEMIARYQRAGGTIEWLITSNKTAKAIFTFKDDKPLTFEYTWDDATLAGLTSKDNWKRMPKEMLRARCASGGIRMSYPACLNNMYSIEEAQDIPVRAEDDIPTIEYTDVQVEKKLTVNDLKQKLSKELKNIGFNTAMIKEFAEHFGLAENEELLLIMATDKDRLLGAVELFENGETK